MKQETFTEKVVYTHLLLTGYVLGLGVLFVLYFYILPATDSIALALFIGIPTLAIFAILSSFILPAAIIEILALSYVAMVIVNKNKRNEIQRFLTKAWFWVTVLIALVAVGVLMFYIPEMLSQMEWFVEGFL
jgi:hypothetical protein